MTIYYDIGSLFGQLCVIYIPLFQNIFMTESLSLYDLLWVIILSSSVLWFDEALKFYRNSYSHNGFSTRYYYSCGVGRHAKPEGGAAATGSAENFMRSYSDSVEIEMNSYRSSSYRALLGDDV